MFKRARQFFEAYKGTDSEEHLKAARKQIKAVVQETGKEIIKDHVTSVGYFISNSENQENNQTQEDKGRQYLKETEEKIIKRPIWQQSHGKFTRVEKKSWLVLHFFRMI
mgnify:CR=1 FL=1